jgi:hypothetical protein
VTEAIFGLVGVVVGGLITAGTTYAVESNKRRREGRVAVVTALADINEALEAIGGSTWPIGWNLTSWNESWNAIRPGLAIILKPKQFGVVGRAYGSMFRIQHGLQTKDGGATIETSDREFFGAARKNLDNANNELSSIKVK